MNESINRSVDQPFNNLGLANTHSKTHNLFNHTDMAGHLQLHWRRRRPCSCSLEGLGDQSLLSEAVGHILLSESYCQPREVSYTTIHTKRNHNHRYWDIPVLITVEHYTLYIEHILNDSNLSMVTKRLHQYSYNVDLLFFLSSQKIFSG